ncbi:methyltransferase domain-containing protein [Aspergillus ambiguus]|uniref:putative S-adenosylmethionine-dependent methyltransferase n=1 Tax=Aspergillus ambiguus TaxID=176160 RepID=UPI003CCE07F9
MAEDSHPTYLSPSELGTKDYWEAFYARTLTHIGSKRSAAPPTPSPSRPAKDHDSDSNSDSDESVDDDDDPGTSWFSEHNAPDKVLQFLTDEAFPLAPCHHARPSILDLGTGNGSMLALLRTRGGFAGPMVGVDYSPRSVELARELQRLKIHSAYLADEDGDAEEAVDTDIRFEEWDILHATDALSDAASAGNAPSLDWFPYTQGGFDIVLDKGTFDAVSLSDEVVEEETEDAAAAPKRAVRRRVCERYPGIARRLVRPGGFVVVTSCNWTEEELVAWFTRAEDGVQDRLAVWGRVEYPRFRFGGKEGQGVCTVCFQRV